MNTLVARRSDASLPQAADDRFLAWFEARLADDPEACEDRVLDYLIGLALADAY